MRDEKYVCEPCRYSVPEREGEIVVPGGTNGVVWCPWCGDKMQKYEEKCSRIQQSGFDYNNTDELNELVEAWRTDPLKTPKECAEELQKIVDRDEPATERHPYSLRGSYKVLREIGEGRIAALIDTPVYHLLRPKPKDDD